MKIGATHQRQQTLRLTHRPAVAEEAQEEHQAADADEDVHALVDQLRLREPLKPSKSRQKFEVECKSRR